VRLQAQACANKRSLEAEVRQILERRTRDFDDIVSDLRSFHEEMVARHGYLPDSTSLIREMRENDE
jgi:hypothetical protein